MFVLVQRSHETWYGPHTEWRYGERYRQKDQCLPHALSSLSSLSSLSGLSSLNDLSGLSCLSCLSCLSTLASLNNN